MSILAANTHCHSRVAPRVVGGRPPELPGASRIRLGPPPPPSTRAVAHRTRRPAVRPTSPAPTSLCILYNKFSQRVFRLARDFHAPGTGSPASTRPSRRGRPAAAEISVFPRQQAARDGECGSLPPARGQERSTIIEQPARRGRNQTFVGFEQAEIVIVCSSPPPDGGNCTISERSVRGGEMYGLSAKVR